MAFPVTCPSCGKAFQLATEIYERKVAGKIVSIKCKQCQAGIRVDATKPGELKVVGATPPGGGDLSVGPKPAAAPAAPSAEAKPAAAPVRMRQPTLIGMVTPALSGGKPVAPAAPKPAAPKPAAPAPSLWAVDAGGTGEDRELNDEEIKRDILSKKLTAQTLVWREGMAEWQEIEKIPELARHLEQVRDDKTPPAAPAAERPKPPEAPAPKQTASFQDEPDGEATMVYDRSAPNAALEPFAAPEPKPPAAPGFGMTMPLGSPQAPAAPGFGMTAPLGAPPPPPLPAAGRPAPPAPAPAPPAARPAPPAPPPPALPAAARPPAPTPAAPPAPPPPAPAPAAFDEPEPEPARPAPPPPVPPAAPAFPAPAAQAPVLAAVPWGDALPSAKPAVPAAPAAPYGPDPFALAAATNLDFPEPRSKKPLVIAAIVGVVVVIGIGIMIASSSSVPEANIAAPPPAPTTPTETPKAPEPEKTSEPVAQNDNRDPVAPAKQPDAPSGGFSDLFSKGAEKAKGSGSGDAKAFDESKARASLSELLDAAAACKEPGGSLGQTTATVTFEPSGSVSGVTVGAPFAGTPTGTCIINAFKRAKVEPFAGLPRTVSQTISLR